MDIYPVGSDNLFQKLRTHHFIEIDGQCSCSSQPLDKELLPVCVLGLDAFRGDQGLALSGTPAHRMNLNNENFQLELPTKIFF